MTAPPREHCTDSRGHFWRAVDSTRGQCARCGQIETFAAPAPPVAQPAEPPATDDLDRDCDIFRNTPVGHTLAAARSLIERQAREIAELKSERDAAQRAGVTTANYWMERAELAEDQRERTRDVWATRAERAEAERDVWKDKAETRGRDGCEARAERDALREVVKAADAMRLGLDCPMCDSGKLRNPAKEHWDTCAFANYDAARAKVPK